MIQEGKMNPNFIICSSSFMSWFNSIKDGEANDYCPYGNQLIKEFSRGKQNQSKRPIVDTSAWIGSISNSHEQPNLQE